MMFGGESCVCSGRGASWWWCFTLERHIIQQLFSPVLLYFLFEDEVISVTCYLKCGLMLFSPPSFPAV